MSVWLVSVAALCVFTSVVQARRLHMSLASSALRQDDCMTNEAMKAWMEYVQSTEPEHLQPRCKPELLQSTSPCKGVAVLFHGISSCPDQYDDLGPMLVARGWDVLLPLNPGHGRNYVDLGNGSVKDDLSKVPMDANGWSEFVDKIASILKLTRGPKAALGLSASGPVSLLLGRYRNSDGSPLVQRIMPASPAMGSGNYFTNLVRAVRWIPGVGYIKPGWGAQCEAARKQGRQGFCQFGIDQMGPVLAFAQSIVNTAAQALPGQIIQVVYTTGDSMVNAKNLRRFLQNAQSDEAVVGSCVLPFSMHSFISPHEEQDRNKYWLNEFDCRIVSFLTGTDDFGQDLQENGLMQTGSSEKDELTCKLTCAEETCLYKDLQRPFTCPFPRE